MCKEDTAFLDEPQIFVISIPFEVNSQSSHCFHSFWPLQLVHSSLVNRIQPGMTRSSYKPQDPQFEQNCRENFARQGIMTTLGATMRLIEPGRCIIDLPFSDRLTQQDGFFHAGATSTIADSAGGYAALTLMPSGSRILTVEFKINLLSPANGASLTAEGKVIKAGKTLTITQIEVTTNRQGQDVLCAIVQQTAICLRPN